MLGALHCCVLHSDAEAKILEYKMTLKKDSLVKYSIEDPYFDWYGPADNSQSDSLPKLVDDTSTVSYMYNEDVHVLATLCGRHILCNREKLVKSSLFFEALLSDRWSTAAAEDSANHNNVTKVDFEASFAWSSLCLCHGVMPFLSSPLDTLPNKISAPFIEYCRDMFISADFFDVPSFKRHVEFILYDSLTQTIQAQSFDKCFLSCYPDLLYLSQAHSWDNLYQLCICNLASRFHIFNQNFDCCRKLMEMSKADGEESVTHQSKPIIRELSQIFKLHIKRRMLLSGGAASFTVTAFNAFQESAPTATDSEGVAAFQPDSVNRAHVYVAVLLELHAIGVRWTNPSQWGHEYRDFIIRLTEAFLALAPPDSVFVFDKILFLWPNYQFTDFVQDCLSATLSTLTVLDLTKCLKKLKFNKVDKLAERLRLELGKRRFSQLHDNKGKTACSQNSLDHIDLRLSMSELDEVNALLKYRQMHTLSVLLQMHRVFQPADKVFNTEFVTYLNVVMHM